MTAFDPLMDRARQTADRHGPLDQSKTPDPLFRCENGTLFWRSYQCTPQFLKRVRAEFVSSPQWTYQGEGSAELIAQIDAALAQMETAHVQG